MNKCCEHEVILNENKTRTTQMNNFTFDARSTNGQISSQINKEETFEEMIKRINTEERRASFSLTNFTKLPEIELFEKMIVFLSMKHIEGDKFSIKTRAGWDCEIEMDSNSGLVLDEVLNVKRIVLYLGIGTYPHARISRCPTFLIKGDKGVSFWDTITDIEVAMKSGEVHMYNTSSFEQSLKNVLPRKKLLNFGSLLQKYQEHNSRADKLLIQTMDILSDAVIKCRDGDVKIVRYLLAKDSEFFLNLFRYEPDKREFKMDFDTIVVQTYVNYHLYLMGVYKLDIEKMFGDVVQIIEFGFFVQDIHFVREIYHLIAEECDYETLETLNELMKKIVSFD